MWTGKYDNLEYMAQIFPYHGKICAEIIKRNAETGDHEGRASSDLWLTVMDKSFGRSMANQPREKDWIAAHVWVNEQFELISKYGTVIITKPKFLRDI